MLYSTAYNHKKSSTYKRLSFGVNLTSKSLWYADEADGFVNDGLDLGLIYCFYTYMQVISVDLRRFKFNYTQ